MHKYAVVSLHTFNQKGRKPRLPKTGQRFIAGNIQMQACLHTIGYDSILRAQQTIQEGRYPQMLPGKGHGVSPEAVSPQVLIRMAIVGQEGRRRLSHAKLPIGFAYTKGDSPTATKSMRNVLDAHLRHFRRHLLGNVQKRTGRRSNVRHGPAHRFSLGQQYLHNVTKLAR